MKRTFIIGGRYTQLEMVNPIAYSRRIKTIGHVHQIPFDYLVIEFHKGGVYSYHPVPRKFYAEMLTADSPGSFFESHIKGKEYKFTKLKEYPNEILDGR